MDDFRRKFLMSSTALMGAVVLPGCGGGDETPQAAMDGGGRATAQSAVPTTVNTSYLNFSTSSFGPLDSIFKEPNQVAMTPVANITQAVYSQSLRTLYIRVMEVITGVDSSVHHRSFQLWLSGFDPSVTTPQDFSSTAGAGYRGSFVDLVLKGDVLTRYEYGIDVSQQMGIVNATALPSNKVSLSLFASIAVPKQTNLFSAPQAAVDMEAGSNKAVNPVAISTKVVKSGGTTGVGGLVLNYAVESGSWI